MKIRLPELVVPGQRLGRSVEHDPRSWAYRVEAAANPVSKRWERRVGIFDQGDTGSCTGNAAVGCLGTTPFYESLRVKLASGVALDEAEARTVYSDAEQLDGGAGLPSEDNGSTGLSVAKVCKSLGLISGYRHAFGINDVIAGLQTSPGITGITWLTGCDTPDANGIVHWAGTARGGHEIEIDEVDLERELVGFDNSWSSTWGAAGRFYMPIADYTKALADGGDVVFFTPLDQPAPTPAPTAGMTWTASNTADRQAVATFAAAPHMHTSTNGLAAAAINRGSWA